MMEYLIEKNVPKNKIIMTVPFYGHSFRLKSPNDYKLGAPAEANPEMSDVTLQKGVLSYAEICEMSKFRFRKPCENTKRVKFLNKNTITIE